MHYKNWLIPDKLIGKTYKRLPFILFLFSISVTLVITWFISKSYENKAHERFSGISSDITTHFLNSLHNHEQLLLAATGLFITNEKVTREDWRRYISSFHLEESHQGILGVGFSAWLLPSETDDNVRQIRSEGFSNYMIKPSGSRSVYTSIIYLEPFNWRNQRAFGYDMYTERKRRSAMDKAIDSGNITIAAKIILVQEKEEDKQSGILMYSPLYRRGEPTSTVEERRTAIRGFVYSPIRMNDFIYGTLGNMPEDVSFEIYADEPSGEDNQLFNSLKTESKVVPKDFSPDFSNHVKVEAYGKTWHILYKTLPSFSKYLEKKLAFSSILLGLIWSSFIFLYTRHLQRHHETLAEKKLRLENIIKGTDSGTWELNIQTGETVFNERWAEIIGYTLLELSPISVETWKSLTHPDDLKRAEIELKRHIKDKQHPYTLDFRMKHKNGDWIWISTHGSVTTYAKDGSPLIMQGIHIEISDRKNSEIQLQQALENTRKAKKTLDAILENMSDWYWELDANGRYIDCSARVEKQLGYIPDEIVGKTPFDFMTPEEAKRVANIFIKITEQKANIVDLENWNITKDGKLVLHSTNGVPLLDYNGNLTGYCGVDKDITDLYNFKTSLRKQARAIQQSPTSILITDANGILEFVNESFCKLSGYTAEETFGKNPRFLKSGTTPQETYTELWSTITTGKTWEGELQNRRKDGTLYWVHAIISALYDDYGVISNFIAVKQDITEKKRLMEMLVHTQKVETVGQLAGGLAHDLNNILSVINGYASLLKIKAPLNEKEIRYIDGIMEAVEQAATLSQSMLAYSRKQIMKQTVCDINLLIDKLCNFAKRLLPENIDFSLILADESLLVNVDVGQIEQVILNITTNARDAMLDGGRLTVTLGVEDGLIESSHESSQTIDVSNIPKNYAVIMVADSGQGMDEETKSRIFDPFFTTKDVGKGTGLGLAMVYGIIEQHNGKIEVQSSLGHGTIFKIKLPLVNSHLPAELEISKHIDGSNIGDNSAVGKILIAEDNESFRIVLSEFLTDAGYEVITAEDGNKAIDRFKCDISGIHLVISDLVMPNKSGKAAYDEIRKLSTTTKFIFMSGHTRDLIMHQGELGDAELLMKPIDLPLLLSKVREIL